MNDRMGIAPKRYDNVMVTLHWLIALMVLGNILGILTMPLWPKSWLPTLFTIHMSNGLTVLGLAAMRLLWRFTHPLPPFTPDKKAWERALASATFVGWYVILFAMPITGYLMASAHGTGQVATSYWGLFNIPSPGFIAHADAGQRHEIHETFENAHGLLAWVIAGLFTVHVAGALKGQYVDHDRELGRMGVGPA